MNPNVLASIGAATWIVVALAITFWPAIYAVIRKRWLRVATYTALCAVAFGVSMYVRSWWENGNPDGDWEFGAPGTLYYGLSWPVTTAAAWAVAAITDASVALSTAKGKHD